MVLPGHEPRRPARRYRRWARHLFEEVPSTAPRPCFEVRFWCAPWGPASVGIWPEFGACPLAFIEYLLIGVASLLFPDDFLNEEGVNRRSADEQPAFAYSPGVPSAVAVGACNRSGLCSQSGPFFARIS